MVRKLVYGHLFWCVVAQGSAWAQMPGDGGKVFEGGAVLGANITQVDGDTYGGFHKVGLNTGGMVYVHLGPRWGVSMELLYVQKGSRGGEIRESYTVGTYIDKYYLNLNYVEVPLMLHLKLGGIMDYELGAAYARLVKSEEWAYADVPTYFDPVLCRFNSEEYSLVAGAIARLNDHWFGEVRFQYSVVPIRPWDRILPRYSTGSYLGQYSDVVCFRLGYFF